MKILKEIPYYRLCGLTEWRMVKGHPRYSVSCNGEVLCWNYMNRGNPKLCKLFKNTKGYVLVHIGEKNIRVHRLVAESFIPNPQNKPQVDHINTIRDDNRVENLKWTTSIENQNNPLTIKHLNEKHPMRGKFGAEHNRSKTIVQLTLEEKFIKKYGGILEAERELGISATSICACCKGKLKSAGGFKWMYYSDWIKLSSTQYQK